MREKSLFNGDPRIFKMFRWCKNPYLGIIKMIELRYLLQAKHLI